MTFFASLLLAATATQQADGPHVRVADTARPSLVAVRSLALMGERSGTGVFLDDQGLILTSYWIVPAGAREIRVWTTEPKLYTGEIVATSEADEFTLIRIKRDGTRPIPRIPSTDAQIGDVSYTAGNAYNSMINDNQPAFNFGLLSGRYNLSRARANSYFTGWVLETTAAVNWGMEGGPLLDSRGRMIGMITLNYSPHRWLGNAIPMENLAPRIEALLKEKAEAAAPRAEEGPQRAGSIGMTVRPEAGGFVADRVDEDGPAWDVGIRPGDPVLGIGANDLTGVEQFERFVSELKAGDIAWLRISLLGREREVRIEVGPSSKKEERK